ncbi:MAG: tetratricopeptide repeat protein [Bacteroidota bacterium]
MRLLIFLVALAIAPAFAQSTPPARTATEVLLGIHTQEAAALYTAGRAATIDFRLAEANDLYRQLGAVEPTSPAAAYGLQTAALYQALLMEREPYLGRFYALNDSLADLADALPDSPEAEVLRGTARLHRALAYGRQERYTQAGRAFRSACGRFKRLARTSIPYPEADFGDGLCQIVAGSIPREYRWLGRLLGFTGTVQDGLAALERAAQDGPFQIEAAATFGIADASINERRAGAIGHFAEMAERYPASPLLGYLNGFLALSDRRASDAEEALQRAHAAQEAPGVMPVPFVQATLGLALFRLDRFEEATDHLDAFVRGHRGKALVAHSTLLSGLAWEMSGDRPRAEATYRRVRALRDYDSDESAVREAAERLEAPMSPSQRTLLLGANAFDSGRYERAVQVLQPIVTDSNLPQKERAEAAYRTGRAYQALENWDRAVGHFRLAADRPGDPLAKWGPWSLYHMGEVYEAKGELAEAREAYEDALDNDDAFDYRKSLEQRARAALERL